MVARLSLAQQIALLEDAAPVDLDPENVHASDAEGGPSVEPSAREHYIDVGPSLLRKQHDSISDPKYEGTSVTRKQIMEEDSDEYMESDHELGSHDSAEESQSDEHEAASSSDEENHAPTPRRNDGLGERQTPDHELTEGLAAEAELRKKGAEDREKGMAVSRQLALWDSLLDARIRIQKAVTAANRLPPPLEVKECLASPDCKDSVDKLLKETALLSNEIFQLQEYLLVSNESMQPPPPKRRKIIPDGDADIDFGQWLEDATKDASSLENFYHPHLVHTLAKWSSKIQAVSPSVLLPPNRNAFSSKRSQSTKTVLELIDELVVDSDKLLNRTQLRRSKGARVGGPEASDDNQEEHDSNIFDDTDFYQQMLRDVIDARGNASGGDWMAVQKQKRAKKTVDTKASKGRKLRYEIHEKLQNFMVPVPVVGNWHEEQIDELFASLLGKGFENVNQDIEDEAQVEEVAYLDEALNDGFRVFG